MQAAENSVVSLAMCIHYKSGNRVITDRRWKGGAIICTYHIVDGVVKRFVHTKPLFRDYFDDKNKEGSVEWEEEE